MTTFRERCGDSYDAVVAYELYLDMKSRNFVNHLALEPDCELSAAQEDWLGEIIKRAEIQQRIERGQCKLPPTLD